MRPKEQDTKRKERKRKKEKKKKKKEKEKKKKLRTNKEQLSLEFGKKLRTIQPHFEKHGSYKKKRVYVFHENYIYTLRTHACTIISLRHSRIDPLPYVTKDGIHI